MSYQGVTLSTTCSMDTEDSIGAIALRTYGPHTSVCKTTIPSGSARASRGSI